MADKSKTGNGSATRGLQLDDPLLAAAAALFERGPWGSVSVEAAAAAAGVPVEAALAKYPSSAYLARGIYQAVLDQIPARLTELTAGSSGVNLEDRLGAIVTTEITMLQPYKGFVGRSILELVNPLSSAARLQVPLMDRFLGYVEDQIALARDAGAVSWWIVPGVAAKSFGALHAQLVTYWLVLDTGDRPTKTLDQVNRGIALFVKVLGSGARAGSTPLQSAPRYTTQPLGGSKAAKARVT